MKRIFTFTLALIFTCLFSVFNIQAQFSGGGTGTAADPFKIKTADDLNNVRNYIGSSHADKHFQLMNDIDLTTFLENYNEGWLPIGDNNNRFTGYFHGGGYMVNGLWINRSSMDYVGFFGTNSGTIDSLMIVVSSVKTIIGKDYAGGFVGFNNLGTITYCGVEGSSSVIISGECFIGGFAGYHYGGTITNCYSTVNSFASRTYSPTYSGGFIGYNQGGTINSCYATGNSSSVSTIHTSYSGGFVGYCSAGTITNCYATGNSLSSSSPHYGSYSGGFVGYLLGGQISNCYSVGEGSAFASYCNYSNALSQCYYDSDKNGTSAGTNVGINNVFGVSTTGMKSKATFKNWDFNTIWTIEENITYPYLYNNQPNNVVEGEEFVCTNSSHTYAAYSGKSNYVWTVTNGSLLSGQSTNRITVKWNNNTNPGKITVTYNGTVTVKKNIIIVPLPKPVITGNMKPNRGSSDSYITEANMSEYNWIVINGEILSGQGTNQISVKWDCSASIGQVKVNYTNEGGCNANTPTDSTVTLQLVPVFSVSGKENPYIGDSENYILVGTASNFSWSATNGEILSGQNSNSVMVSWKSTSGKLIANYNNEYGCPAVSELSVAPVQLFGGGLGTTDNPYLIKTAEQLSNIRMVPTAHYTLANNIDLSDYLKNTTAGWTPIPNFYGSFDGRFFKIKGLWINQPNSNVLGLFANNSGTIENLYVEIGTKGITGKDRIGALCGSNSGIIYRCAATEGSITAKGNYIGGLVGANIGGNITESYSANTVVWGNQYVGGLVGVTQAETDKNVNREANILQCYSLNTVVGSSETGGLVGNMDSSEFVYSNWGTSYFYGVAKISQSYSVGIVSGGSYTGGFLGYNHTYTNSNVQYEGTIVGCYYDEEVSEQYDGLGNPDNSQAVNIKAKYTSDMMKQKTFLAWDFNNVWKINEQESYPYFKWQDIAPTPPPSGLIQAQANPVRIYPNPTNGIVTVDCEPNSALQIYSLPGKLLYRTVTQSNQETIDLSNYPNGLYLVKVGNTLQKVIKK